jgi:hypothetical protein
MESEVLHKPSEAWAEIITDSSTRRQKAGVSSLREDMPQSKIHKMVI